MKKRQKTNPLARRVFSMRVSPAESKTLGRLAKHFHTSPSAYIRHLISAAADVLAACVDDAESK